MFVSCDSGIGDRMDFTLNLDGNRLYVCTSIDLSPVDLGRVESALQESPAGFGGCTTLRVDPDQLWNVKTVSDLIRIIKTAERSVE